MKNLGVFTAVCLFATISHGATFVYEGFDYGDGVGLEGQSGGSGWTGNWDDKDAVENDFVTNSTGLSYTFTDTSASLQTEGRGATRGGNGFATMDREISSVGNTTLYFSGLFSAPSNNLNDRIFVLDDGSTVGQNRFRLTNDGSGQISMGVKTIGGSGSVETVATTTGLDLSNPVFFVGRIIIGDGANDSFTVWFNPTDHTDISGSASETLSVLESAVSGGGSFSAGLNRYGMQSTNRANVWDEVRISYGDGASINDVVVIPEPSSLMLMGIAAGVWALVRRRKS